MFIGQAIGDPILMFFKVKANPPTTKNKPDPKRAKTDVYFALLYTSRPPAPHHHLHLYLVQTDLYLIKTFDCVNMDRYKHMNGHRLPEVAIPIRVIMVLLLTARTLASLYTGGPLAEDRPPVQDGTEHFAFSI